MSTPRIMASVVVLVLFVVLGLVVDSTPSTDETFNPDNFDYVYQTRFDDHESGGVTCLISGSTVNLIVDYTVLTVGETVSASSTLVISQSSDDAKVEYTLGSTTSSQYLEADHSMTAGLDMEYSKGRVSLPYLPLFTYIGNNGDLMCFRTVVPTQLNYKSDQM